MKQERRRYESFSAVKNILFFIAAVFTRRFGLYRGCVDTTDAAGYGFDSSFKAESMRIVGAKLIYGFVFGHEGYFDHSFDEIKKVPDIILPTGTGNSTEDPCAHCFIVQNPKDGTYAKVKIISRLPDGRYVYRFGKNTIPNDKLLEKPDYDRTKHYKPNNFHQSFLYRTDYPIPEFVQRNTFKWEPPLQNNHRLLGYIFYISKTSNIDTTAPVNYSQWEKTGLVSSTSYENTGQYVSYLNLVAVYEDDTTEFLKGWTRKTAFAIKVSDERYSLLNQNKGFLPEERRDFSVESAPAHPVLFSLDGRAFYPPPAGRNPRAEILLFRENSSSYKRVLNFEYPMER